MIIGSAEKNSFHTEEQKIEAYDKIKALCPEAIDITFGGTAYGGKYPSVENCIFVRIPFKENINRVRINFQSEFNQQFIPLHILEGKPNMVIYSTTLPLDEDNQSFGDDILGALEKASDGTKTEERPFGIVVTAYFSRLSPTQLKLFFTVNPTYVTGTYDEAMTVIATTLEEDLHLENHLEFALNEVFSAPA